MPRRSGAPGGGVCFGFSPSSDLPFRFLRAGGGDRLAVREGKPDQPAYAQEQPPLLEWRPRPDHPFEARVFGAPDGGYGIWIGGCGWYEVGAVGSSITVPAAADPVRREQRLWGIPAALAFKGRGDLPLHAAAVDVGGKALLLCAPGRFGKTTLAAGFHQAGHRLLTEDLACVRLDPSPAVLPGPPTLRLRRDIAARLTLPDVTTVAEDEDRLHLAIDGARLGSGAAVPLAGIVFLRVAGERRLEPADPAMWLPSLWTTSFNLPIDDDRRRCFEGVARLAATVPTYVLDRPLDFDRLADDVAALAALAANPMAQGARG